MLLAVHHPRACLTNYMPTDEKKIQNRVFSQHYMHTEPQRLVLRHF